jgi:hypothetical protein
MNSNPEPWRECFAGLVTKISTSWIINTNLKHAQCLTGTRGAFEPIKSVLLLYDSFKISKRFPYYSSSLHPACGTF